MMAGAGVAAAPAAAPEAVEEEEEAPQAVQTSFTIKMEKYDASKKVQKFTRTLSHRIYQNSMLMS